jgi:hypothetical protein
MIGFLANNTIRGDDAWKNHWHQQKHTRKRLAHDRLSCLRLIHAGERRVAFHQLARELIRIASRRRSTNCEQGNQGNQRQQQRQHDNTKHE